MPEITLGVAATRIYVDGDSFESDVPIGAHIHYAPDDGSQGRTGNLNWIPGVETSGGPGQIQEGLYSDGEGNIHISVSRRMVVNKTPGQLTVTIYQDPELLGEKFAAQATIAVV